MAIMLEMALTGSTKRVLTVKLENAFFADGPVLRDAVS